MADAQHRTGQGPARREASGGMIEFFCPNGHRIRVDSALAGRRGACTECRAPVTIPLPAGAPAPSAANPLEDLSGTNADPFGDPLGLSAESGELDGVQDDAAGDSAGEAAWHPSADLVARLWAEREHGGTVEVHHADGVIVPEWYDVTWSRGTYGVFGSQAADGSITITAVAWDSVRKVIVRNVRTLPADMFPTPG